MRRLLALLLLAGVAVAGRTTIVEWADRVLAAAKEPAKLQALAAMGRSDHWAIADELSSRGEHDVAFAFARASKRKDRKKLVGYLESRRANPTPRGSWAALVPIWRRNFTDPKGVPALVAPYVKQGGFVGSFALTTHAVSLVVTGRYAEAEPLLKRALATMEQLGCLDDTAWNLDWLAIVASRTGRLDEAERRYRRILELHEGSPHVRWRVIGLKGLGMLLANRNEMRKAAAVFDECVRLVRESGESGGLGSALYLAARAREQLGETKRALELAEAALVASKAEGSPPRVAGALLLVGQIQNNLGNHREALRRYQEALTLHKRNRDRHGVVSCLTGLGNAENGLGREAAALRHLEAALAVENRAPRPAVQLDLLKSCGRLGVRLERFDAAEPRLREALELAQERGAAKIEAQCRIDLANIALARGRTRKARENLDAALVVAQKLADPYLLAWHAWSLSDFHRKTGNPAAAIEAARRGVELYLKAGRPLKAVSLLGSLASIYSDLKRFGDALRAAERAAKLASAGPDPLKRGWANHNLASALMSLKRFEKAHAVASKEIASGRAHSPHLETELLIVAAGALKGLGRHEESSRRYLEAAEAAERAGLKDRARGAVEEASGLALNRGDSKQLLRIARLTRERARRMKDPKAALGARGWEGMALVLQGEYKEAERILIEVREEAGRRGDHTLLGGVLSSLGHLYRDTRDWARARSCFEAGLAAMRETGKRSAVAMSLFHLAGFEQAVGHDAAARRRYEELLSIAEELDLGRLRARAHAGLGEVHLERSELLKAEQRFVAARKVWAGRNNRVEEARCLTWIGRVYDRRGNLKAAMPYVQQALRMLDKSWDKDLKSETLNFYAVALTSAGRYAAAEKILRGVIESGKGEAHNKGVINAQRGLANLCEVRGDLKGAYAGFAASLAAAERAGEPPRQLVLRRIELADAARDLGRFKQARDQLALARAAAEGSSFWTAKVLNALGWLCQVEGDYDAALAAHREQGRLSVEAGLEGPKLESDTAIAAIHLERGRFALAAGLYRKVLAASEERGQVYNAGYARLSLSRALQGLGKLPEAIKLAERAAADLEKLGSRRMFANALNRLGNLHSGMGDFGAATRYERRALAIRRKNGSRKGEAISLGNLAAWAIHQGNDDDAIGMLERSVELYREIGFEGGLATSLGNLAALHDRRGDTRRARPMFEEALAINRRIGRKHRLPQLLAKLGWYKCFQDKQTDEGLALCREALAIAEEIRSPREILSALVDLTAVLSRRGDHEAALAAARRGIKIAQGLTRGLADEHAAMARGQQFQIATGGIAAAHALSRIDEIVFFIESARAGGLLEALGGRERVSRHLLPDQLLGEERQARARARAAEKALQQAVRAKSRRRIKTARRELAAAHDAVREVVARIQRSQKAAAGVLYPKPASLAEIQAALREGEAYVAYAKLPKAYVWVALIVTRARAKFHGLGPIAPLEKACAAFDARGPERAVDPAPLARRLIRSLGLGPEVRRLLISTDDVLAELPFALLTDREVVNVPSATTWLRLRKDVTSKSQAILALGDPDYTGTKLAALPATRAEAKAIGEVVLLGKQATPANLVEALGRKKRWRAVHLACHGLLDTERPTRSALALTGGRLTVLDVFRLKVPADLVTLSACETARGKHFRAEGVMGLPRAFMLAGAPRAIVSLWMVDDEATRVLMVKFYKLWETLPAATALRRAQEFVRGHDKWKHPYYWAAWQLWGLPE